MTKKGLPGFLRRSIRNLEEKDDAINDAFSMPANVNVGSPAPTSLIPPTSSSSKKATINIGTPNKAKALEKKADSDDDDDVNTGLSHTVNRRLRMELSTPDRPERKTSKEEFNLASNASTVSSETMTNGSTPLNVAIPEDPSNHSYGSETSSKMSVETTNNTANKGTGMGVPPKTMETSSALSPTGSVSSNKSSGTVNSVNRKSPTKQKSFKEKEFDNVIQKSVVNIGDLRKLAWNGIPVRYMFWILFCGGVS